jgi:hypothetical protein
MKSIKLDSLLKTQIPAWDLLSTSYQTHRGVMEKAFLESVSLLGELKYTTWQHIIDYDRG